MSTIIDPNKNWLLIEQRLATESAPVLRRNLEVVLKHMKAEAQLDFEGLMSTVADDARYHFFGSEGNEAFAGPKGKQAIEAFYKTIIAMDIHRIEHNIDRLVVDQHCVVTDGEMRIAYPGQLLKDMGHDIVDTSAYYLYVTRSAIFWPIDEDGLILGEDSYTGDDGFAGIEQRKLGSDDIIAVEPP